MEKQKLTKTGEWIWREDEISYKSFTLLSKESKLEHLKFLFRLGKHNFSSNDWYIMRNYGPPNYFDDKSRPFLSLNENESQQEIDASTRPDLSFIEEEMENYSKQDIEELLDTYFYDYKNWKWDFRATTPTKFINAIKTNKDYQDVIGKLLVKYSKL
jgi:hypothetical protein